MHNQPKIGDKVRLAGGGPLMTITNVVTMSDGLVDCTWFDKDLHVFSLRVNSQALIAVEDDAPHHQMNVR